MKPAESQDQEEVEGEAVCPVAPMDLSALAVPREDLHQFLERVVQLTLGCWGDFHCVLYTTRALVGESKGLKWYNIKIYTWTHSFHDAIYIYGRVTGMLQGPRTDIETYKAPTDLADTP